MCQADTKQFQSHNGAIAASLQICWLEGQLCFNPTMVRLLLVSLVRQWIDEFRVSIPQWCDCCLIDLSLLMRQKWFQSHNGAIAAV